MGRTAYARHLDSSSGALLLLLLLPTSMWTLAKAKCSVSPSSLGNTDELGREDPIPHQQRTAQKIMPLIYTFVIEDG